MEQLAEDQSHYEISMTAGQAFAAFVLLLLSLAAAFAFGLLIGKGQLDERLAVRKEPAVINEATIIPHKSVPRTVELSSDDFKPTIENVAPPSGGLPPSAAVAAPSPVAAGGGGAPQAAGGGGAPPEPVYAQLLSSSDQKVAEAMAAKLIDGGFPTAYVERSTTEKGTTFRVRVKFPSEVEARAAEAKLREFSKEVWITK